MIKINLHQDTWQEKETEAQGRRIEYMRSQRYS